LGRGAGFIHRLDADGAVVTSFGATPFQPRAGLALQGLLPGSLLADVGAGNVLFVPSNPYELHVYTADGDLLRVLPRLDPGFTPLFRDFAGAGVLPPDRVLTVVRRPTGEFVTQVVKRHEAQNETGDEFGEERLLHAVRGAGAEPAEVLVARVFDAIDGFVGAAPQFDDITLFVLRKLESER
jgi:hypothetical protein